LDVPRFLELWFGLLHPPRGYSAKGGIPVWTPPSDGEANQRDGRAEGVWSLNHGHDATMSVSAGWPHSDRPSMPSATRFLNNWLTGRRSSSRQAGDPGSAPWLPGRAPRLRAAGAANPPSRSSRFL
jgi:hypothetical protein